MPDHDFNELYKNLRGQVEALASLTVRKYKRQAARDGKKLLTNMKGDLKRWSALLDQGLLTTEDFEWLVQSQSSTLKMAALEKTALADSRVQQFKLSLFTMFIDTIFDTVIGKIPD
ncbi:MAG: hypothetical protein AAFP19_17465 [Bacteroidota bacterium]